MVALWPCWFPCQTALKHTHVQSPHLQKYTYICMCVSVCVNTPHNNKLVLQFVDKMTTNRVVPMVWIGFATRLMPVTRVTVLRTSLARFATFRSFSCLRYLLSARMYVYEYVYMYIVFTWLAHCEWASISYSQLKGKNCAQRNEKRNKIKCREMNWNCFDWQICYDQ